MKFYKDNPKRGNGGDAGKIIVFLIPLFVCALYMATVSLVTVKQMFCGEFGKIRAVDIFGTVVFIITASIFAAGKYGLI